MIEYPIDNEMIKAMEVRTMLDQMNNTENLKANGNFLTIPPQVIKDEIKGNVLLQVNKAKIPSCENMYYAYNLSGANLVLMHIKNNQYIMVSHYVYHDNKIIDIPSELSKFKWSSYRVGGYRQFIKGTGQPSINKAIQSKTIYLHRVLMMFDLAGNYIPLKRSYDIHHKGDCYDNRTGCTMYIPRKDHKHRKNHMTGRIIRTSEDLIDFLNSRLDMYSALCKKTIID